MGTHFRPLSSSKVRTAAGNSRRESRRRDGNPSTGPKAGPSRRTVFSTLRRHWGKSLLFAITMLAATALTLVAAPRSYTSEAKLFVRIGRESIGLDPTATTGQTLMLSREHEFELNSIAQILGSRKLIEAVVDELGPERILNPGARVEAAPKEEWMRLLHRGREYVTLRVAEAIRWVRDLDPVTDRDRAVHELSKAVEIEVPKRSSVLQVICNAETPELAHDVTAALVAAYMEEHIRVNRTAGSYDFFDEQANILNRELTYAGQQLCDLKNQSGLLTVESQRTILQEQLGLNLSEQSRVEASLSAATRQIASFEDSLKPMESRIATQAVSGFDNAAADRMREKLYELELRRAQLMTQYTAEHPLVVAIEKQLTDARSIFQTQPESRTQQTLTVNTNFQTLELSLLNEKARQASFEAELETLQAQHKQLVVQREALNRDELRMNELERQVAMLETSYAAHMEKREQSRINQALEMGRISNVNVAQPASFVARPVSPNKLIVVLVGVVFAFGGALALPFCFEEPRDPMLKLEMAVGQPPAERIPPRTPTIATISSSEPDAAHELVGR